MKKPLIERFQQLAGLKPLYEISPELKARAAQSAAQQGRKDQARKFGSSMGWGDNQGRDAALGDFIDKELGYPVNDRGDYDFNGTNKFLKIIKADIDGDGFNFLAVSDRGNDKAQFYYNKEQDTLSVNLSGKSMQDLKGNIFDRADVALFKNMISTVNPESKLGKSHWASFKLDGEEIKK